MGLGLIGLAGLGAGTSLLGAAQTSAASLHNKCIPSANRAATIPPLQSGCHISEKSCHSDGANRSGAGKSYAYPNGAYLQILYTEKLYCDANVSSAANTACEATGLPRRAPRDPSPLGY